MYLPCDPTNPFLVIYQRERKEVYFHTKMYTQMFIAALLVMTPNWK